MAVKRLWHPDKVLRYAEIIKICRPGTEFNSINLTKISKIQGLGFKNFGKLGSRPYI